MIETYSSYAEGRTRVYLKVTDNKITGIFTGNQIVATEQGLQFYVDDYVAEQIHKFDFYLDGLTPQLKLKEEEELKIPTEIEQKQKEIKQLEERLKQLKENAE